ncbi:DotA/TraY family protein [Aquitalea pelogenes]|uniref:DotA/TraY family protein n=1 Tax=Aquitalea pelogenes TaxID=1293573 RepID=UPI0035B21420
MLRRILLFLSMLLFAQTALASGAPDLFTPSSNDVSMKILGSMFGDLFSKYTSGGVDVLSGPMGVFNQAVLIVGGILATYTLLAGTLGTAHDGEMLGKGFSSIWVPIRYAFGTALIIPVQGGYCGAQLLIAWLVAQSVGMADGVWNTYTSTSNTAKMVVVGYNAPDLKNAVWNAFQSYSCIEAYKASLTHADPIIVGNNAASTIGVTTEETADSLIYSFGDKTGNLFEKDVCGTVSVPKLKVPTITTSKTFDQALEIDFSSAPALNEKIQAVQKAQLSKVLSLLDAEAVKVISTKQAIDPAGVNSILASYQQALSDAAQSAVASIDGLNTLQTNAQKGGWISQFYYFMQYSYLYDQISTSLSATPSATGPVNAGNGKYSSDLSDYIKPIADTVTRGGGTVVFGGSSDQSNSKTSDEKGFFDKVKEMWNKFKADEVAKRIFMGAETHFQASKGEHPIYTMKRLGDNLTAVSSGGLIAGGGIMFTLGAHPGISAFVQTLMMIVLVPMLVTGFMLKYFLPFMPFLMGIGVIGGWLMGVAIAIIAAPLWVVGHLNPHADDMVGSSGQGYRLVLSMTLRPTLITLGMIVVFTAIIVVGGFINETFLLAFNLSQSGSSIFGWLMAIIAAPLLYFVTMYKFIQTMFVYIHKIADEVLEFIGGGGHSVGGSADNMGDHSSHNAGAAAAGAAAGNLLSSMRRNPTGNGGGAGGDGATTEQVKGGKGSGKASIMDKILDREKQNPGMSPGQNKINSLVSGGHLQDTQENHQMKAEYGSMMKALGGENSKLGQRLSETLKANASSYSHANMTPSEILKDSMSSVISGSYGRQALEAIQASTGGEMSGNNFEHALGELTTAKEQIFNNADLSTSEKQKTFSDAARSLKNDLKDNAQAMKDGTVTKQQLFAKNLGQFTGQEMPANPKTPEAPAPQEKEVPKVDDVPKIDDTPKTPNE